ncbi:MAG: GMC family oxidoreductase N-terminal domain-containing protein [Pseudomonadota bacterium]
MTDTFDYIIVGAGSAGCVIASRLSEDPDSTVCVLEAGPPDRHPMIHIPVGWMKLMTNPRLNWMYQTEPSEWTGGRAVAVPRGKTLGGSSSINGNIFNRGTPGDFDHWAQLGNSGWGYGDVLPLFKRLEDWTGPDADGRRGRGGRLKVTESPWTHPLCEAFMDGCESLGIPRNPDYNGARQEGVSYTQRTIHRGRRQSAARAFLRPAMQRPNLEIRTGAHAAEILFDGRRATGIRYAQGRQMCAVRARREVILSGGVINSPQLLQLSGIGDPEHLRGIGVEVRHALPGVGENLRDHYTPRFTARVKNAETFNERARGLAFGMEIAKWLAGRPSILSLPATACYAFARSDPALDVNDLQVTFMPASYKEGHQSTLDDRPGMTIAAWQQRPDSLGYVRARSSDPFEKPQIQPNYLSTESDRRVLLAGLRLARAILRTEAMEPFFAGELYPGDAVVSDEDLLATARERGTTTFHMMGTCRMGPEGDATAVVDAELRIRGIEALRVADASIMPSMPSANTNASTLMIGEKAADLIRASH